MEARQLGAVIGGAYERPKIVEELELALGSLDRMGTVPPRVPRSAGRSPMRLAGETE
jgi:hypothetical protein